MTGETYRQPRLSPEASASWRELQRFSAFRGADYHVENAGELNEVLITEGAEKFVIKVPRGNKFGTRESIIHEAYTVDRLESARSVSPLAVPEVVECCVDYGPAYAVFTHVPGETLDANAVEQLSCHEKRKLGEKTAEFIAWFASSVSFADYYEDLYGSEECLPERSSLFVEQWEQAGGLAETHPSLAVALDDVGAEYVSRQEAAGLQPSIIGHYDLRPGNITFMREGEAWAPHGVIDFGITQPSTPECEMRHLSLLDSDMAGVAASRYQEVTGQTVNLELIEFWANIQVLAACAYFARVGNSAELSKKSRYLKTTFPQYDWSELGQA